MTRSEIVLAALAPAEGARHTPVQVQKLLFLVDKEAARLIEGAPFFNFRPYHYGPFDRAVYEVLNDLAEEGLVDLHGDGKVRAYALTPLGQRRGDRILASMTPRAAEYVRRASKFVRTHSFSELVSAIYKEYPEMRQYSVFQG